MFKLIAIALFWPILQAQPNLPYLPQSAYTELSTRWDDAGSFNCGLDRVAAVLVVPAPSPSVGRVIVVDSSGQIAEMRYDPSGWVVVREFSVGEPITAACAGAPHLDQVWRAYVGTKSGKIIEFSRGAMGWLRKSVKDVPPPIVNLVASDPGTSSISQLFVLAGDGSAVNLWVSEAGNWITREIPDIDGGVTEITFDYDKVILQTLIAGPKGQIHQCLQDSTGRWSCSEWASMPAGPLDMAGSADPSMTDMAVFYSGSDGIFRYLFHDYRTDEKARVPIAGGVTHMIGKGSQRRFNEFFAMAANEFCLFEFNFTSRRWDKIPMKKITSPVVSTTMDFGRPGRLVQIYVACVDGTIHEFTRSAVTTKKE